MEVHGQALAGVEQLDEQGRIGPKRATCAGPSQRSGSAATASRTSVPSCRRLRPRVSEPNVVLTAPSHSSGMWSDSSSTPRKAAIRAPPA